MCNKSKVQSLLCFSKSDRWILKHFYHGLLKMISFASGSVLLNKEILKLRSLSLRTKPNIRDRIFPNTDLRSPHTVTSGYYLFIKSYQFYLPFLLVTLNDAALEIHLEYSVSHFFPNSLSTFGNSALTIIVIIFL